MRAFRPCALVLLSALAAGCGERATPELEGKPPGPYRLTLAFAPSVLVPGTETTLTFRLTGTAQRRPLQDLQIIHERALHTFIIARDFSSFAHLHHEDFAPLATQDLAQARFTFPYAFPHAGDYRIVNEFTYRDRTWMKQFDFTVGTPSARTTVKVDLVRERVVGAYRANLAVSPPQPVAGYETELVLTLARGGQPVTDLQLLLGAEVHVALWRIDGEHFGHTHSYTPQMAAMMREMAGHRGRHSAAMMIKMMSAPAALVYPGPQIPIRFTFPQPGVYQLFLQCAPGGETQVFPFMLKVDAYREGMNTHLDSIVPDA
jgi:hypothetical protein